MPICLDLCFQMLVCLDLCSLHALCHHPRACALHSMFVCLDLGFVCHAMCYCSPLLLLSLFLVFWSIGLDPISTLWSWSSSTHRGPYQRVSITPILHVYARLLLCFIFHVSLSSSRLCHIWCPLKVCSCAVTSDAHEALCGCNHLGGISGCWVASCIPFLFSTPCVDMLTMLVCITSSLSMHLYTLTYMSMHESYLLVCHPYFNTMKLWTFDTNLHLSLADTTFCLLVCLFACLSCCL